MRSVPCSPALSHVLSEKCLKNYLEGDHSMQNPLSGDIEELRHSVLTWWKEKGRDFPWRHTTDPYRILVAEILLHRTRAEAVVRVYEKFLERYPDILSLHHARKEEVVQCLHSLGLRWRAEYLWEMARRIVADGGSVKPDRAWLVSLPGVGEYIASAVLCFAFNHPEPVLDTNTVRILGRMSGIPVKDSSRRSRIFREMYSEILDPLHPREFNFAMIDIGALVCRPDKPLCSECPLLKWCRYGILSQQKE